MSFFSLKLYKKSETQYILTIPLYTRFILFLFTAAVGSTFIIDPEFALLPILILTILLLSSLYKESWTFDGSKQEVIYGFGFIFFYRKTIIPFEQIEKLQITTFIKGSLTAKPGQDEPKKMKIFRNDYYKLSLINETYGEMTINTVKGRDKTFLYEYSAEIARICKAKLVEQ